MLKVVVLFAPMSVSIFKNMQHIFIYHGDLTKAKADAIVNAPNPKMLGGGGVDGAIHMAAGKRLLEECRKVKPLNGIRCPFGEARITTAGNLNAKYVIHTVGPRYRHSENPKELLESAYNNSLLLAKENACNSIAFPAISCGSYGYPPTEAAEIAIDICRQDAYKNLKIEFYIIGLGLYKIWRAANSNFGSSSKII